MKGRQKSKHKRSRSFSINYNEKSSQQNPSKENQHSQSITNLIELSSAKAQQTISIVEQLQSIPVNPEFLVKSQVQFNARLMRNFIQPCLENQLVFPQRSKLKVRIEARGKRKIKECRDPIGKNFKMMNQMAIISEDFSTLGDLWEPCQQRRIAIKN